MPSMPHAVFVRVTSVLIWVNILAMVVNIPAPLPRGTGSIGRISCLTMTSGQRSQRHCHACQAYCLTSMGT